MGISKSDEDISAANSNLSKLKDEIYGENLESIVEARISTNPIFDTPFPSIPFSGTDPTVLYVDPDISVLEGFVGITTFRNLKSALRAAPHYATILIKPGVYGGYANSGLTIDKEVSIGRWGEYGEVIFEGDGVRNIFNIQKNVNLYNLIFRNCANDFGGALIINSNSTITNCTFQNNRARYGGAVHIADNKSCLFKDCKFINNAASLGGGAIYTWNGKGIFKQCVFNNCTSQFGGAIFSLNGYLDLDYDIFNDNQAFAFGGGIYKKWGTLNIYEGNYVNNSAYYDGGAVYIINGTSSIERALFEENFANYGGDSIHSISTDLNLQEPIFQNATGKTTIETKYINPFIDLGNYTMIVSKISDDLEKIPSSFNLADHGWVTSVKSQGKFSLCWDFAAIAVVESAVKKATGKELDLSENHLKNMIAEYSSYGWDRDPNDGGGKWTAIPYFINALGPILEATEPLRTFGFSPLLNNVLLISNIVNLSRDRDYPLDNSDVKQAIMDYGAIRASMNTDYHKGYNYYSYNETSTNHAVAIVGWDDEYDKEKFGNNCPGNGAWIAKNSWGKNSGKDGYIYISYYDKSFAYQDLIYVVFNNTMKFDRIYQYDYGLYWDKICPDSSVAYKNVYTSVNDEDIGAVSTFFYGNTNWKVFIYVEDELKHQQSGWTYESGYFTINLDKKIRVKEGQKFSVVIEVNKNVVPCAEKELNSLTCGEGVSFVYSPSSNKWTDLDNKTTHSVARIKVYTANRNFTDVIDPITNVTYGNPIHITFYCKNRTAINYILMKEGSNDPLMGIVQGNELILPDLEIGNYEIAINFIEGNSNISSYFANFTVNRIPSLIEIEDIPSIIYGNNLTVYFHTENVSNPVFTYTVTHDWWGDIINGTCLSNETNKSIDLPIIKAGECRITIHTSGDEIYANSSTTKYFKVLKSKPVVSIDVCDGSNAEEFKINVTSDITESYFVKIGDAIKFVGFSTPGTKTVTIKNIPNGNYTICLEFMGTSNYGQMEEYLNTTVVKASSNLTIKDVLCSHYHKNITVIDYSLSHAGKASVILKNRDSGEIIDVPMEITERQITIEGLGEGNYTMTLFNKGNEIYEECINSVDFTIFEQNMTFFGCSYQIAT